MTSAAGRRLATAYSVANASDNLYLVINGKTLWRLERELSNGPGGLLEGPSDKFCENCGTKLGR